MAIDVSIPRTRRALLAGGIGGLAAVVASALGRPLPADAVSGSFDSAVATTPAVQGLNSAASGSPAIGVYGRSSSAEGTGVRGFASHGSGNTYGVSGTSVSTNGIGVRGSATVASGFTHGVFGSSFSTGGIGVRGDATAASGHTFGAYGKSASNSGTGVLGWATALSGRTYGIYGQSDSTSGTGVFGFTGAPSGPTGGVYGRVHSPDGTGVIGYCGTDANPAPVPKTGVYGYAVQDSGSRGVHGRSTAGRGVYGQATSGVGLYGYATTGFALRANGRIKLDKCAGVATIATGSDRVSVDPEIDLSSTSAVVATLQGNAGSTSTAVSRASVNTSTNRFEIILTANATATVKVAWIVLG